MVLPQPIEDPTEETMPGTRTTPDQRSKAMAMRAAGFTLSAIAAETKLSVRTLSRLLSRCQTKPEPITDEMIQRERERMLQSIDSAERVREAIASSIADSLALTRAIREKVALALDVIDIDNHEEAREAARALAQLASALKATQSVYRSTFGDDETSPAKPTELTIREMMPDEVLAAQQAVNDARHREIEDDLDDNLDVRNVA